MGILNSNNSSIQHPHQPITTLSKTNVEQIRHTDLPQKDISCIKSKTSVPNNPSNEARYNMCNEIQENNKKCSIIRKNSKQRYLSLGAQSKQLKKLQNVWNQMKQYKKSEQKLKYFENNKKLVEQTIQTTICVQRVLNILRDREILQKQQFNYLNSRNMKSLQCKQKRYKNLEFRQKKIRNNLSHNNLITEQSVHVNRFRSKNTSSLHSQKQNIHHPKIKIFKNHNLVIRRV